MCLAVRTEEAARVLPRNAEPPPAWTRAAAEPKIRERADQGVGEVGTQAVPSLCNELRAGVAETMVGTERSIS